MTEDMTGDMTGEMTGDMTDPEVMADPNMTETAQPILPFHGGIYGPMEGENSVLVIFASRVPAVLGTPGALVEGTATQTSSDLRRFIYWLERMASAARSGCG